MYALGEIALVVIGILIALQINNWNEWRNDRSEETYYLEELKDEFVSNKDMVISYIEFHHAQMRNAQIILSLLKGNATHTTLDTIHGALMLTGHGWSPLFDMNLWSEILSTGKLSLLRDGELRNKIGECYSMMDQLIKFDEEWSSWNVRFRQKTGQALPADLRIAIGEAVGHYKLIDTIREPLLSRTELQQRFQSVEGIEALVSDVIIVRRVGIILLNELHQKIDVIIDHLETSLAGS